MAKTRMTQLAVFKAIADIVELLPDFTLERIRLKLVTENTTEDKPVYEMAVGMVERDTRRWMDEVLRFHNALYVVTGFKTVPAAYEQALKTLSREEAAEYILRAGGVLNVIEKYEAEREGNVQRHGDSGAGGRRKR